MFLFFIKNTHEYVPLPTYQVFSQLCELDNSLYIVFKLDNYFYILFQ